MVLQLYVAHNVDYVNVYFMVAHTYSYSLPCLLLICTYLFWEVHNLLIAPPVEFQEETYLRIASHPL